MSEFFDNFSLLLFFSSNSKYFLRKFNKTQLNFVPSSDKNRTFWRHKRSLCLSSRKQPIFAIKIACNELAKSIEFFITYLYLDFCGARCLKFWKNTLIKSWQKFTMGFGKLFKLFAKFCAWGVGSEPRFKVLEPLQQPTFIFELRFLVF